MPRKIDYELKSRSKVIKKDLNKQNAIVDAVRQGKIVKAEILSNTELVAKDPIHQALIAKQAEESIKSNLKTKEVNDNILTELRTIANRRNVNNTKILEEIRDLLTLQRFEKDAIDLPLPLSDEEGAVGLPVTPTGEKGTKLFYDPDEGLSEDLIKEFGRPSKMKIDYNKTDLQGILLVLEDRISNLKSKKGGYTKSKNYLKLDEIKQEVKSLEDYKQEVENVFRNYDKIVKGKGIMTNLVDLKERLQLLVGSIEAGNGSKELKNELADILHYLYKNKMINLNAYKMFMNLTH